MNNTDRFTGKARAYAQGRPDYPASVVGLLTQESRRENPRLADIGSGTGILSRAMLERGWTVYGVEPNDDMRKEAEKRLSAFPRFHSVAGTAERTGLPGASVDLVTAAQSFHWFDAAAFKRECRRLLSRGGKVALIWNSRGGRQSHCPGGRKYPPFLLSVLLWIQRRAGEVDGQHWSVFQPPFPGIPLSK